MQQANIALAPFSSFQIGGPADFFAEAPTKEEFIEILKDAKNKNTPFYILGGGSNILFHENGFRGLIIRPTFKKITVSKNRIIAEAGGLLSQLVQEAIKNNLSGMEEWVGLPGTVGGAIRGNAGANGVETKDILKEAEIFDLQKEKIETKQSSEMQFEYRNSIFKNNNNLFILSGTFELKEENPDKQKMMEILRKRNITQPKGKSAGCVFKNPVNGISAGALIDQSGCKGMRIGDMEISQTHGNFFINHGHGTQSEALQLIEKAKKVVKEKTGYELETEIEIIPQAFPKLQF